MPVRVLACLTPGCTVMWFRNKTGVCRRCKQPGIPYDWKLEKEE